MNGKDHFNIIPFEPNRIKDENREKKEKDEVRIEHTENKKLIKVFLPRKIPITIEFEDKPTKLFRKIARMYKEIGQELNNFEKQAVLEELNKLFSRLKEEEKKERIKREAKLTFEEKGIRIEVNADDGIILFPSSIFYRTSKSILIGDILFSLAKIQKKNDEEYETIEPIVVWTIHNENGIQRFAKPLRLLDYITIDDRPIAIRKEREIKDNPIETFISLNCVTERFLKGEDPRPLKELYEKVRETIRKFVNFAWDERLYDLCSCWVIASYFYDVFSTFPFLYFYGPSGTGKTRANLTITLLARHGIIITDPTKSFIYRFAQALKPTLGIDESLIGPEIWKIVRVCFKKGLKVPRMEGSGKEGFSLRFFDTYIPIVFSASSRPSEVGGEEADESRAIFINMEKAPDPIGRDPEVKEFQDLRDDLYLYRLLGINEVLKTYQEIKSQDLGLYGREKEVWLPVFTIAYLIGVLDKIKSLAIELYEVKSLALYEKERVVLKAIQRLCELTTETKKLVQEGKEEVIEFNASSLVELIKQVLINEGEFEEKQFSKLWNPRSIGRILSRLNIHKKRTGKERKYLLTLTRLKELCTKYNVEIGDSDVSDVSGLKNRPSEKIFLIESNHQKISESSRHFSVPETSQTSLEHKTEDSYGDVSSEKSDVRNVIIKICETCKYFNKDASYCLLTNTLTTPTSTCDNWSPKEPKQDEKSQEEKKETKGQEVKQDPGFSCKDCKHYITSNNKCSKHPEWIFISPFSKPCEFFEPKEDNK